MEVVDILLMDKGDGASTEFDFDNDVADYIMDKVMENPEWMAIKIGLIHSHHNMGTFFSGTDWAELATNSIKHNFYLSLIVNNAFELIAKLVYIVKPCAYLSRDENGEEYEMDTPFIEKPQMWVHDCDIDMPIQEVLVDETFRKRVEEIINKVKTKPYVYTPPKEIPQSTSKGGQQTKKLNTHQSWENPQQRAFDKMIGGDIIKETEKKEDIIIFDGLASELDELFACYLIRLGELFPKDDLEQALQVMQDEGVDGIKLVNAIIPNIGQMYAMFMFKMGELEDIKEIEMEDFLMTLENVIDNLSDYEGKYPFVIPLIADLRQIIEMTEQAWKELLFPSEEKDNKEKLKTVIVN